MLHPKRIKRIKIFLNRKFSILSKKKIWKERRKAYMLLSLFVTLLILTLNSKYFLKKAITNFLERWNGKTTLLHDYSMKNFFVIERVQSNWNSFIFYWKHFLDPVTSEGMNLFEFFNDIILNKILLGLVKFLNSSSSFLIIFQTIILLFVGLAAIIFLNYTEKITNYKTSIPAKALIHYYSFLDKHYVYLKKIIKEIKIKLKNYKHPILIFILCCLILNSFLSLILGDIISMVKNTVEYLSTFMEEDSKAIGIYSLGPDLFLFLIAIVGKIIFKYPFLAFFLSIIIVYLLLKLFVLRNQKKAKEKWIKVIRSDDE